MNIKNTLILLVGVVGLGGVPAWAADEHEAHHADAATAEQAAVAMSEGEVKKIDKEQGKITLKHGELKNLGMPPMTMNFRVKDAAMLDQVTVGQRIKFVAEDVNGALTIMQMQ